MTAGKRAQVRLCEAPLCVEETTAYATIEGQRGGLWICPMHIAELRAIGATFIPLERD